MKLAKRCGVVALLCLVGTGAWAQVQAQVQEGGTIRGTVYVSRSEPLPEALVEVVGTGLKATTNADGEFEIRDVPPAKHVLKITFPGYKNVTRSVELAAGKSVSLEADMELDEQFGEEMVITGSKFGEKRLEFPRQGRIRKRQFLRHAVERLIDARARLYADDQQIDRIRQAVLNFASARVHRAA
jgi:iron complex outermembrane receptor protein